MVSETSKKKESVTSKGVKNSEKSSDKLLEIKILMGSFFLGVLGLGIYSISNYASSDDKRPEALTYIILVISVIVILIIIIFSTFKNHKDKIKNLMNTIRDFKYKHNYLYPLSIINVVLILVVLGMFAYYSGAGGNDVLNSDYKRHCIPGTSYGEKLKDPENY